MSSLSPSSGVSSSVSSSPSLSRFTTFPPPPPTGFPGPPPPPTGTGNPNSFNNNGSNNGSGLATSASLYLYTFLATLVLLLSVSAAIVVRSYVLRRRQRLAMEEAIRNGTWVPPAPPFRAPRVDLSRKPGLWEVYLSSTLGNRSREIWLGEKQNGNTRGIGTEWKEENLCDWESIKPLSAAITAPTSLDAWISPPSNSYQGAEMPVPVPGGAAADDLPAPNTASPASNPLHRTLLDRARQVLSPALTPTSPLPGPPMNNNDATTSSPNNDLAMTELRLRAAADQPQVMKVAVFIAMPSPHSRPSSLNSFTQSPPGTTLASASSVNPPAPPPNSQQHYPASNTPGNDGDDQPLPHLEMGVAEVLVVRHPESDLSQSMQRKSRVSESSEFDSP